MPNYNKMEKKQANKDGARIVKNSGRGVHKGDAKLGNWLIDYKFNSKTFTLNPNNWKKHRDDARNEAFRDPVIVVVFDDGTRLAIVDWDLLQDMEMKR